jgi:hypothetical protein
MDISVVSSQNRLDALESKARNPPVSLDLELQSQIARFLCVLASGLIEQAVISLLDTYIRRRSEPRVQRYAIHQISRLQNAKFEDILIMVGRFDPAWRTHLEANVSEEKKSAIDSIVNNRNQIAHGKQVNISLGTFSNYYLSAKAFMVDLESFLQSQ